MDKASVSFIVTPNKQTISRQAQTFCMSPSKNMRDIKTSDCRFDSRYGIVKIDEEWNPQDYLYGKDTMVFSPDNSAVFVESKGALGKDDVAVGFSGNSTTPATTPWGMALNDSNDVLENQAIQFSFIWYRPNSETNPSLLFIPRVNTGIYNASMYFSPFILAIDEGMKLRVYEYPYDDYTAFLTNANNLYMETFRHPLNIGVEELSSSWHSIRVIPVSPNDLIIESDILVNGGFLYRSSIERNNIKLSPNGNPYVVSLVGGTSQVQMTPLDIAATGSFKSATLSKSVSDNTYPTLKVFGWSPLETDNNGYMDGVSIPAEGYAGISYEIYSVVDTPDWVNFNDVTETLVSATDPAEFKDFRYKITLTADGNVSPVINDLIFEFTGSDTTNIDEPIDISDDVISFSETIASDIASYKASLSVRNQGGKYNALAERPMNEVAVNIAGVDVAVLYTLNTGYEWFTTPTQAALKLDWECGDGFEYLRNELVANHPPYDGQKLSQAITDFMSRIGYDATRVEIEDTPGLYLPSKRGKDNYMYRPENGTPAIDFVTKLKEWFRNDWECRFNGAGKFIFKSITETTIPIGSGVSAIVPTRIYYPASSQKPTPDDYVMYKDASVELLHDEFFNEIWVVGEDTRTQKPMIGIYQNLPSQNDKEAPDYIGRRKIMLVPTACNRMDAINWILAELVKHYGKLRSRITFVSREDPMLKPFDFISVYGCANIWRINSITNNVSIQTMPTSTINSTTAYITGSQITATQWPVVQ